MLHVLKDLLGSRVLATDGEIGTVQNFLFDDQSWTIRYLIADVGHVLKRREVVLAISAVEQPDWANRCFHVSYTNEQVRNSPDIDTEKPVTRQQEIAMEEYYHWLAYWIDSGLGTGSTLPPGSDYPVNTKEDPHLRSAVDVTGYAVWATDGEVGDLYGFVMDEISWHLGYLDVKAGHWLHSRSVLIPTRWVKSLSWARHRVNLQHTREGI
ncbi:MAG TPA: PRC-barrel domain-containing protein [Terracidiphilus sp.]|jgi:hypothetical protein